MAMTIELAATPSDADAIDAGAADADFADAPSVTVAVGASKIKPGAALLDKDDAESAGATMFSSVINLSNVIMGVGLLALPLAFSQAGWLAGMLLALGLGCGGWASKCGSPSSPPKPPPRSE